MEKLVIFDLDGTLLNTIADLAYSTNYALQQNGFPVHAVETYNFFVGNGINKLFERALPEGMKTEENIGKIRKEFLPYYDQHNTDYTTPYAGILTVLGRLQEAGYLLAVASNKYQQATEKLIRHFFPEIRFISVLGQREGIAVKPDPAIVYTIMETAGVKKENVLYVGDSGVDMQTATNSGVTSLGVTWGFRPRTELEENHADAIVERPEEILAYLSLSK